MFESTRFIKAADLRQHRLGGDLHLAVPQCVTDRCSRVTVTINPKIVEPGVGGVVRDRSGTYLHSGSRFTNHWRRVGGKPGKDLVCWDALADDVVLVRPGIELVPASAFVNLERA